MSERGEGTPGPETKEGSLNSASGLFDQLSALVDQESVSEAEYQEARAKRKQLGDMSDKYHVQNPQRSTNRIRNTGTRDEIILARLPEVADALELIDDKLEELEEKYKK